MSVQPFARPGSDPKGSARVQDPILQWAMQNCSCFPGAPIALFLFRQILPQYLHLCSELLDNLSQILDRGQLFLDPCGNLRVSEQVG